MTKTTIVLPLTAALCLSACTDNPEAEDTVTVQEGSSTDAVSSGVPESDQAERSSAVLSDADLPQAEPGLVVEWPSPAVIRHDVVKIDDATFGTPGGTVEIRSMAKADTVPGNEIFANEAEYRPADGEEFFVFDVDYTPSHEPRAQDPTLYVESAGARTYVADVFGQGSYLMSLPPAVEGALLIVSSDGHDQEFDIAAGVRIPDPLTDVYLRPVLQQDLTDRVDFEPVVVNDAEREFTASVQLRSAHITPHVPALSGNQGWAEPGNMWLILSYTSDYEATKDGWSRLRPTLEWGVEGAAEPVIAKVGKSVAVPQELVVSIPADSDTVEVRITNRLEVNEGTAGNDVADFGSETFTLNFPRKK